MSFYYSRYERHEPGRMGQKRVTWLKWVENSRFALFSLFCASTRKSGALTHYRSAPLHRIAAAKPAIDPLFPNARLGSALTR